MDRDEPPTYHAFDSSGEGRARFLSIDPPVLGYDLHSEGWFAAMESAGLVLGFIAVIGGLSIGALAIILGIRHDRRKREMEHIERMRALELGRTLPQDEPWLSPAKLAALFGAVVPLGVFVSVGTATSSSGYHEEMWLAATCVGITAVISGATVACLSGRTRKASDSPAAVKPYIEEDAYDVVSSRG
jgi:hypothetical protein